MSEDLDLNLLTTSSARIAVQERETTAVALVEKFYEKIESEDRKPGQTNAYLNLTRERALAQAQKIDKIADSGNPLPPLGGVPIAVKDVIVTAGVRTTAGSKILGDYVHPMMRLPFLVLNRLARSFWENSTAMSSPWAPRTRTRRWARCGIRAT